MIENKNENEYEIVAKFTDENCTFTIKEPVENSLEKMKAYYAALSKAAFSQRQKP